VPGLSALGSNPLSHCTSGSCHRTPWNRAKSRSVECTIAPYSAACAATVASVPRLPPKPASSRREKKRSRVN
jgi:hypothetical protein